MRVHGRMDAAILEINNCLARTTPKIHLPKMGTMPLTFCSVGRLTAALEFSTIFALAMVSGYLFCGAPLRSFSNIDSTTFVAAVASTLFCLGMQAQHLYRPSAILNPTSLNQRTLATWSGVLCVLLLLGFLAKASELFSRGAIISLFLEGALVLPLGRRVAKFALEHAIDHNYLAGRSRVVVFGDRRELTLRDVAANLARHGYNVTRQFEVSLTEADELQSCKEISSSFDRLQAFVRENHVDEVFLVFATSDSRSIDIVSWRMRELPIPARLLFDQSVSRFLSHSLLDLGAAKAVKLQGGPLTPTQQALKRSLDLAISVSGLVALAPLLIAIAVLIRLDSPGPIIFRQRRAGFSGRTFCIYKFRSMTVQDDGDDVKQAVRGDKRVTRVGRFLRKTSLDELPQLLNVLRGEMSIVGPRPHALSHDSLYNKVIATYALRHHMKPGITGWAQVSGFRGETTDLALMSARVDCDLWYIVHWKFLLDLKIMLSTLLQLLRPTNVY